MRPSPSLAALAVILAAASTALPRTGRAQVLAAAPEAQLHPGDMLRITVWRQPELSGEFRILADGTIAHPLYQQIVATGTPLPELTARIKTFLTRLINDPQVVIEPLVSVAVGGQVRNPGLFTLPLGTTISEAIAQAGGGATDASLRNVRLVRDAQRLEVDLSDTRRNQASMPVRSGDQIFVMQRGNAFRDVIGPVAAILGAAAAIVTVIRR